jgi:hypothetical protein
MIARTAWLLLLLLPGPALAQTAWRWVDDNGVVSYAGNRNFIPERHRQQATPFGPAMTVRPLGPPAGSPASAPAARPGHPVPAPLSSAPGFREQLTSPQPVPVLPQVPPIRR